MVLQKKIQHFQSTENLFISEFRGSINLITTCNTTTTHQDMTICLASKKNKDVKFVTFNLTSTVLRTMNPLKRKATT